MATIYVNPLVDAGESSANKPEAGYEGYIKPDTKIPPKGKPVLDAVSVNGVSICEEAILAEAQNHPSATPGAALKAAARALVVRELLLQEAEQLGITPPSNTGTDQTETAEDSKIRLLIEQEVHAPTATESECLRHYEAHPSAFYSDTLYEARHILLAPDVVENFETTKIIALDLLKKLARGEMDFALAARQFSACPSSSEGGNLGQLSRGSTVPEFEAVLEKMAEGELWPDLVESKFGFHIIKLEHRIEGKRLPFSVVKDKIAAWLEASSWSKAVSHYIAILAGKADIKGVDFEGAKTPLIQ